MTQRTNHDLESDLIHERSVQHARDRGVSSSALPSKPVPLRRLPFTYILAGLRLPSGAIVPVGVDLLQGEATHRWILG